MQYKDKEEMLEAKDKATENSNNWWGNETKEKPKVIGSLSSIDETEVPSLKGLNVGDNFSFIVSGKVSSVSKPPEVEEDPNTPNMEKKGIKYSLEVLLMRPEKINRRIA